MIYKIKQGSLQGWSEDINFSNNTCQVKRHVCVDFIIICWTDLNDSGYSLLCVLFFSTSCSTESGAAVCEYFMRNMCNRGPVCPFRHTKGEKTVVCKHWLRGLCKKGDQCEFLHEYDMTKMPECYFYSKFGEFALLLSGYYQYYFQFAMDILSIYWMF